MPFNPETIATIIGSVIAAVAAGKGIEIYIGRKRSQNNTENRTENTNPGLNIVTESECRETRKELVNSIGKQTGEIKVALKEQTKAINKLTVSVTRIEGKLETASAETDTKLARHISTFHRKKETGDFSKTGS